MYSLIASTDARLRVPSDIVNDIDGLDVIVAAMFDICRSHGGVALAAPQLGITKQIIVIEHNNLVLLNPTITSIYVENVYGQNINTSFPSKEGCLSLPGVTRTVQRSMMIRVIGETYTATKLIAPIEFYAYGLYAAIIQHEVDHLQGKLITDY